MSSIIHEIRLVQMADSATGTRKTVIFCLFFSFKWNILRIVLSEGDTAAREVRWMLNERPDYPIERVAFMQPDHFGWIESDGRFLNLFRKGKILTIRPENLLDRNQKSRLPFKPVLDFCYLSETRLFIAGGSYLYEVTLGEKKDYSVRRLCGSPVIRKQTGGDWLAPVTRIEFDRKGTLYILATNNTSSEGSSVLFKYIGE